MATTKTITLSPTTWLAVATAAQGVTLAGHSRGLRYAVTPDTNPPPADTLGALIPIETNQSLTLGASDRLWLRGEGLATVIAETLLV